MTWDIRITSKIRSEDNAKKQVLHALQKEEAENTVLLHVGDEWPDQLRRELQLIRHFVIQSACDMRFPQICTLITDLSDQMTKREEKNDKNLLLLAELAFQGVDSPYLDLFQRVPTEYLEEMKCKLRYRPKPLWKASADKLLAHEWGFRGENFIDAFRDTDERCVYVRLPNPPPYMRPSSR